MIFPWETQLPAAPEPVQAPAVEDTVAALQRDVAYMVQFTAVLIRSDHAELRDVVNTRRGQIIPRGECKFTDGTSFEIQDLGMPQPNSPEMTVREIVDRVWKTARGLGLELA